MFVAPEGQKSPEYQAFWSGLAAGEFKVAEFKRIDKDGREVWIQASYNPMRDRRGRTYRVVKFATDVTAKKLQNADLQGQIAALHKALAVIEFSLDGTIIGANSNFLSVMGYAEEEIRARHFRPSGASQRARRNSSFCRNAGGSLHPDDDAAADRFLDQTVVR